MAEQELSLLIRLKDEASAQLRQINQELETSAKSWRDNFGSIQGQLRSSGMMLAGFGAVVTGAFALIYKASEEDRMEITRLANQLKNIGVSYDAVKDSLNQYTDSMQKSTGYSRSEQISTLSTLILMTGNYNEALKYLPLTLDLAASRQISSSVAAQLMGRVLEGDINVLHRYIGGMDGAKTSAQALDWMQRNLTGSAQAANTPLKNLQNSLSDLNEIIGNIVAGPIGKLLDAVSSVLATIKEWAEKNPGWVKLLGEFAMAMGIAAGVVGGLSLAVVGLMVSLAMLGGPVTLVIAIIGAVIAAGILLIFEWDWVKENWTNIWLAVAGALVVINPIFAVIAALIALAPFLIEHWDTARGFWENIWNEMKTIALGAINLIFDGINLLLKAVELLGKAIGQDWSINIPKISEEAWGIYKQLPGGAKGHAINPITSLMGTNTLSIDIFGRYGNLGQTAAVGGQNININVEGSLLKGEDLANLIRQELLKLQNRNSNTGLQ